MQNQIKSVCVSTSQMLCVYASSLIARGAVRGETLSVCASRLIARGAVEHRKPDWNRFHSWKIFFLRLLAFSIDFFTASSTFFMIIITDTSFSMYKLTMTKFAIFRNSLRRNYFVSWTRSWTTDRKKKKVETSSKQRDIYNMNNSLQKNQ